VDSLLVKVTTGQGLEGGGEAFGFTAVPVTQRAIDELIAPLCAAGTPPASLRSCDVRAKLHVFGQGPVALALSAADIALRDIAGKAPGAPLHRLLGGAPPTWPAMRVWTPTQIPRWSARLPGGRSTPDSRALSCTKKSFRRFAPLTKRPGLRRS
jgi:L-alanine-DL-glutamate epimerase-like enolase superfamily enzyme